MGPITAKRHTAPTHGDNGSLGEKPALGIDLGGTKTEAIVLAPDGGTLARWRTPSKRGDYDGTVRLIRDMAADAGSRFGALGGIGIGIPGTISPATGLVKNANSTWLIGRPFQDDLTEALGRVPSIANDADCFALSEATDGAGAGAGTVWGIILGTGVGGGIVVRGRLLAGPNAIAGEWGHNPLPRPTDDERPGPACYCGHHGCIEQFVSGPGFAADHRAHGGEDLAPADIVAAAKDGLPSAVAALDRYVDRLARATAAVINILDPDIVVLGGGMSNVRALYDRLPAQWGAHAFSDRIDTPLRPPIHGDSSGVRGAAWLGRAVVDGGQ